MKKLYTSNTFPFCLFKSNYFLNKYFILSVLIFSAFSEQLFAQEIWLGTVSTDWNTGANWNSGAVPVSTTDVIINSSAPNQPEIKTGDAGCNNLTINNEASLLMFSNALFLKGDLIINGTGAFVQVGGALELNGSTIQNIPAISCYNLKINNASGINCYGNLNIVSSINFAKGILNTNGNVVQIFNSSPAAITGFTNSSFVNGKIMRYIDNGTFDFPVGNKTNFELVTITINNISPTKYLIVEYLSDNTGCTNLPDANGGPVVNETEIVHLLNGGYWRIAPDQQPAEGDFTAELNETGFTNSPNGPEYCSAITRVDCFSNWQSTGFHTNATQKFSGSTVTAVRSSLSVFGDFAIGYSESVLPITLSDFSVSYTDKNTNAFLTWTTPSEIGCNYYDIEVATEQAADGGLSFKKIGIVNGSGTTGYAHTYSFTDQELNKSGIRYYRIAENTKDGRINYSSVVSLVFDNENIQVSTLYPNPTNHSVNYNLISGSDKELKITVRNIFGNEIYTEQRMIFKGINKFELNVASLPEGIYFINLSDQHEPEINCRFEKFAE